jgi:phosphoribosyl 1,2-cyclic phosphodiesterase
MEVRVWGCRGSVAAPGPETVKYGGNTSCVEVRLSSGQVLVLDAGTGMRPLGVEMTANGCPEIHILLSHLHLDHLQGLGFFRPLFNPDLEIHIWGPPSPVQPLSDRIAMYLSPPLFPVHLDDVPARLTFHDATEDVVPVGSATMRSGKVLHQGPTVGYRIEEHGLSLAYVPDHEPSLGPSLATSEPEWMSGYDIARDADVLLHDAQYRDHEYHDHVGWGHSALADTVQFASKAGVQNLVLFHHDPYHTDDELETLLTEARRIWPWADDQICLASEGMTIALDGAGVRLGAGSAGDGTRRATGEMGRPYTGGRDSPSP